MSSQRPEDEFLPAIANAIWRETYRHDTLMDWHEVRPGTLHHQRTMEAARAVGALLFAETRSAEELDLISDTSINWNK